MSTIQQARRCFSCGTKLQSEDKSAPGYISPDVFSAHPGGSIFLCDACFRDSRYNIAPRTPDVSADWLEMIKDAKSSDALVIYVVDLFSFESAFPPELVTLLEGMRLMVMANKRDLIQKKVPDEEIKEYVAHRFRASKCSVTSDDVFLVSLRSTSDVRDIAEEMERRRGGHDVILVGSSMAGKSAFRDAYLRQYSNNSNKPVVTVEYGATKIPIMQIPLDESTYIYDAPGIPLSNDIRGICPGIARKVIPSKALSARRFGIGKSGAISVEGLALITLTEGKKTNVSAYFKDELHIHFHISRPVLKSFLRRISEKKVKVIDPNFVDATDFDAFDIAVEEKGQRDIGIEGLGWISFQGNGQTFTVMVPKGVSVYTSRAKIKDKHAK